MEIYQDTTRSAAERAADLLSRMTRKEKIGQVAQPFCLFLEYTVEDGEIRLSEKLKAFIAEYGGIGTYFSLFRADPWSGRTYGTGIPADLREKAYNTFQRYLLEHTRLGIPALVEENAPHGLQVLDGTVYPVSLGMGATFDRDSIRRMARCVGEECRTFGVQVPNFALLDMACDPRFGRTEECLSEDPYLAAQLCGAAVAGAKSAGVMVCCKHYCGQGAVQGGHCGGVSAIGERELREVHLPGVQAAVKNGADFIMASYNDVDGVRCHTNRYLLTEVLQQEFGFDGVIRADRMGCDFGNDWSVSGARCLNAGVMLGLGDQAFTRLGDAIDRGLTSEKTLDEAVFRLLKKKYESGVMDAPLIPEKGQSAAYLASGVSQQSAYDAAARSLVLLKNNGRLPLTTSMKLALFGEHADTVYPILGDYTAPQKAEHVPTLRACLERIVPDTVYTRGWSFTGDNSDLEHACRLAEKADAVVLTLGGSSARDFDGLYNDKGQTLATKNTFMDCGEGRDVADLSFPGNQLLLLRRLKAMGKPVVSVVFQGRPYLLQEAAALSDGLIVAWYPGQEGPRAITDALFGRINCFGRLPVTIPAASGALPVCYNRRSTEKAYADLSESVVFPFGAGMTYSSVLCDNLTVTGDCTAREVEAGAAVTVSLTVRNISDRDSEEVVMLFIRASEGSILRRDRELKGFCRVVLRAGESRQVSFSLGREELQVYAADRQYRVETGHIRVFVGCRIDALKESAFDLT